MTSRSSASSALSRRAESCADELGRETTATAAVGRDGEVLAYVEIMEQLGALPGAAKPAA